MPSTTEGVGSVINGGNRHGTAIKQAVARGTDAGYLELVQSFPLRPIRSEVELDRAIAMIDSLLARDELDPGKADYLDVLSDLVHKYEAEHDPIEPVSDAEMVRFLLESNEVAQTELAKQTGIAESTISEILAAKRQLSRRHIAALSKYFHVSPAVFFHEVEPMTS
jgi:HTH-type transcriptional regulator/antitoxin HigA